MNIPPFLLLTVLLLSACAGIDTDSPGLAKDDVQEAMQRGMVLHGMTPKQVRYVWGDPRERRTTKTGEQWIYNPDMPDAGTGIHSLVTVTFAQGKVDTVINGDLKLKKSQMGSYNDLTRRARSYDGGFTTPGFHSY